METLHMASPGQSFTTLYKRWTAQRHLSSLFAGKSLGMFGTWAYPVTARAGRFRAAGCPALLSLITRRCLATTCRAGDDASPPSRDTRNSTAARAICSLSGDTVDSDGTE